MFDSKKYYIENKEKINKYAKQWQMTERGKELRKRNRKKHREKEAEKDKIQRRKMVKHIRNYKLSKGCSICGYNKCAEALEFHHNGDKNIGIARSIYTYRKFETIKKEMDKCIILCSNCHRELHAKEKESATFLR